MRRVVWMLAAALSITAVLGFASWSGVSAAALGEGDTVSAAPAQPPLRADVNDFTIAAFDAEYRLGRDAEGRSTLHTTERIDAVFPDYDQNRGIIRDLVRVYDGHPTDLTVVSVTDEQGTPRSFDTEVTDDVLSVIIAVPEGSFVHGTQTYVIEYTQRDVTRAFADTRVDEFYWDVNGTDWAQPFDRVSATVVVSPELTASVTGEMACYRGRFGSTDQCRLATATSANGETIISADENDLRPRENLTVAIAFTPGTFAERPTPFLTRVPVLLWAGIASFIAAPAVTLTSLLLAKRRSRTGRAIIAQYEPPANLSVAVAAELLREPKRAMTATLLDLAVRHKIRLLHDQAADVYGAQLLDDTGLLNIERGVCQRLFLTGVGGHLWFDRKTTRLGDTALTLRTRAAAETLSRGWVRKIGRGVIATVIILLIVGVVLGLAQAGLTDSEAIGMVVIGVGVTGGVWLMIGLVRALSAARPLTPSGALLHDHLMGLRDYIRLAEADRIRMLQSASGAEVSTERVVQVYEKLLPYAVLFGYEREWQHELAQYYRESAPDWVAGNTSGSLSDMISLAALSSAVRTSPTTQASSGSGSSFSSSSGGSSGGGFSGGGGGGGGGRGI